MLLEEDLIKQLLIKRASLVKEDQEQVDRWIEQLEKVHFTKELSEHFIVRQFLKEMNEEIEMIESTLMTKYDIDTLTRLHLLDKKDLFKRFISIFNIEPLKNEILKQI